MGVVLSEYVRSRGKHQLFMSQLLNMLLHSKISLPLLANLRSYLNLSEIVSITLASSALLS